MNPLSIARVTAFVDWNSQVHAQPFKDRDVPDAVIADRTLSYVARVVSKTLAAIALELRFDVTLRIYHGWRKGFEATARRRALMSVVAAADFQSMSRRANVSIRPDVEYGDLLLSGRTSRLHSNLHCHLPNTLRRRDSGVDEWEEKMVDTSIASDVVDMAYREPKRWLMIVGDDDDLVPPAFVAEGVRDAADGRVMLLRDRPDTPFFKLDGIGYRP